MHRLPRATQRRRRERRGQATANSGNFALWGEDYVSPLRPNAGVRTAARLHRYDAQLQAHGSVILPVASDGTFVIITCLSCHDGNLAKVGMMKGPTVETVTIVGASFNPPTLLGNDGTAAGNYMNDHPVGPTGDRSVAAAPTTGTAP